MPLVEVRDPGPAVKVLPSPWLLLGLLLALLACTAGGYVWGDHAATTACEAKAGQDEHAVHVAEATRDRHVDAIGAQAHAKGERVRYDTEEAGHERATRIRTVYVPGPCRAVPADILRELEDARQRINAKIRSGLRPAGAAAGAAPADH